MTITAYRTKVGQVIKDTASILDTVDIDAFIAEAVHRYERHRPREMVKNTTGDGNYDYALPSEYIDGFSNIIQIEYPAGERNLATIEDDDWTIYKSEAAIKLRFLHHTPAATETFETLFTTKHKVNSSTDTIVETDFDAVCNLAGALCCESLASYFSQQSDSTIQADAVEHKTRSQEYASRATRLKKLYIEHLGIKEAGGIAAASGTKDLDTKTSYGGKRLIYTRR